MGRRAAAHGAALIKEVLRDLYGTCRKVFRKPCRDFRQDRRVGVRLERADHSIENLLHQSAPHRLTTIIRWPHLDSDGEWRLGRGRLEHLYLAGNTGPQCTGQRQPHLSQLLYADERTQVGPAERGELSPLSPRGYPGRGLVGIGRRDG